MRSATPIIGLLARCRARRSRRRRCGLFAQHGYRRRQSRAGRRCAGQPAGIPGDGRRPRVLRDRFVGADPDRQATLDKQAAWLNHYTNYRILIEGHADERGTREYNIALGARRASVVVNYLVSPWRQRRGASPQKSFGKERPVAICNDISCWSQNRRAVTVVQ